MLIKMKKILTLFALMFLGCNTYDNNFINWNLSEEYTNWTIDALRDLCKESEQVCCPKLSDDGDNFLASVPSMPPNAGLTTMTDYYITRSESTITVLDSITDEKTFKSVIKHEMIHHCNPKEGHLGKGNIMSSSVDGFPLDGKLTDADRDYLNDR